MIEEVPFIPELNYRMMIGPAQNRIQDNALVGKRP
jgi:hypothetical protein